MRRYFLSQRDKELVQNAIRVSRQASPVRFNRRTRKARGGGGGAGARLRSATVAEVGESWITCWLNVWVWHEPSGKMRWEVDDSKDITVWCERFHLGTNKIDSGEVWPEYKRGDNIWIIKDFDSHWYPVTPFYDKVICPGEEPQ